MPSHWTRLGPLDERNFESLVGSLDRDAEAKRRAAFRRQISDSADAAIARAETKSREQHTPRSWMAFMRRLFSACPSLRTRRGLVDMEVPVEALQRCVSGAATAVGGAAKGGSALFGLAGSKDTSPAIRRLVALGENLEQRIATIDARVSASRSEAQQLAKAGNRAAALRALKRAKAFEKQSTALAGTATAIERQSAMLEDAGLQREVANALSASMKGMKKLGVAKALKDVEAAADGAADMRDTSDDIAAALAELGSAYDDPAIDEDDLAAELDSMVEASDPSDPSIGFVGAEAAVPSAAFPKAPQNAVQQENEEAASTESPKLATDGTVASAV